MGVCVCVWSGEGGVGGGRALPVASSPVVVYPAVGTGHLDLPAGSPFLQAQQRPVGVHSQDPGRPGRKREGGVSGTQMLGGVVGRLVARPSNIASVNLVISCNKFFFPLF